MSSVFGWIKSLIKKVWNNIVSAVETMSQEKVVVLEDGTEVHIESALNRMSGKFAAVIITAAGLFFVLFPFEGQAAMAIGDNLIRIATLMWNG